MKDADLQRTRNEILDALIGTRDQLGQPIWVDRKVLAKACNSVLTASEFAFAVGTLVQLDYVEIDRDLKPREALKDFSSIRLTSSGAGFYDFGHRFEVEEDDRETIPVSGPYEMPIPDRLPAGFKLSEKKREQVAFALREAEQKLLAGAADNTNYAQAHGLLVAARVLAEIPEPPVHVIWELLSRANSLAGIASFLVAVLALFLMK